MRYPPDWTTKQKMTIRYNKRCHWSHILSSPLWKNLPCTEEPAILHHCGIHEWPIVRCVLQIRLWKHFIVRIIHAFKGREFRFDFAILLILNLYEEDTNILRHKSIPNTTPFKRDIGLHFKAIKHNTNWDFCTFSINAFDFLFWPSPMEILQIRGCITSPWQRGPSDNPCLCHHCKRKKVFSQKLKVSASMVMTSTTTRKSRKVQFRNVV